MTNPATNRKRSQVNYHRIPRQMEMELHAKSLAKYGPGEEEYNLGTRLTVWDPAKHTSGGVTRLGVNLEHFTIDLGRGRKVWLLNLFVGADLDRALDKDEEVQA